MSDNVIVKAISLANRAHARQHRKYNGLPYIVHPMQVATLLMECGNAAQEEIAAAWMHDVLEDCAQIYTTEMMEQFPGPVFDMVKDLTNPSKFCQHLRRADRKAMDREHLSKCSIVVKRIKLIDRYCNLCDIFQATPDFIRLYCKESELLLPAIQIAHSGYAVKIQARIDHLRDLLSKEGSQ